MLDESSPRLSRRGFLAGAAGAGLGLALGARAEADASADPLPRWRGFNLHYFFGTWNDGQPLEDDYRMIADLGFNFVRLPLWYTRWTDPSDVQKVDEAVLAKIDEAVGYGRKHGIHTCLNFHKAPGYCVAKEPPEPFDLFKDQAALDAFCFQWALFAKRYAGIPADELSFNLVNEPIAQRNDHERVARAAVAAIRAESPERLIIADGLGWGSMTMPELDDLNLVQSTRGYAPNEVSHYQASWTEGADKFPVPTWPIERDGRVRVGRAQLEKRFAPWVARAKAGHGVHCGECGAFNRTPHDVVLAWMGDMFDILTAGGIGYALWEFRGSFGILDSDRGDVDYEDWHGHKLDRKMLELLQAH
ncbi:MAG: cellulase family glycosylhydrolase [Candidatus Hydrogenedens sp.]|nr:cellulase family glycosylhydrolase [Candidatus Hydrogenedens sp.]